MTSNDNQRVAIYVRISRADRADGVATTGNVERQERECREYASQQGWTVTHVFTDNDISGGKDDRTGFADLTKAVNQRLFDIVLATESSRFTRSDDTLFLFKFAVLCSNNNIQLWTKKSGQYDVSNDNSEVMMFLEGFLSKQERKATADRQRRKRRDKSMQGEPLPGRYTPFGWKDKRMQQIDTEEAKWVKSTFEKWNAGVGVYPLTRMLNDAGMRKESGKPFAIKDVKYLLQNEKYCGWVIRDDEVLTKDGKWEHIIDYKTFEIAQKRFEKKTKREPRGNKPKRLLSGKLLCMRPMDDGICGSKMVINDGRYRCTPGQYGCGKNSVNVDKIETYVINELLKPLMDALPESTSEPVDNSAEIAEIDKTLERLRFLFEENDIPTGEYVEKRNKQRAQRDQLVSESAVAVPSVGTFEKFCNADLETQRETLSAFFPDMIGVLPNITGKHALDPNRIVLS